MYTNSDYLKGRFWALFRHMEYKPNQVYPLHLLEINLFKELNMEDRKEMDLLINEMLNEGFVVETSNQDLIKGLRLTQKGYDNFVKI